MVRVTTCCASSDVTTFQTCVLQQGYCFYYLQGDNILECCRDSHVRLLRLPLTVQFHPKSMLQCKWHCESNEFPMNEMVAGLFTSFPIIKCSRRMPTAVGLRATLFRETST